MNKILTTLEKIQEDHQKTVALLTGRQTSVPPTILNNTDVSLADIKMLLQTLIDQVHNLNIYVRSQGGRPLHNTFERGAQTYVKPAEMPNQQERPNWDLDKVIHEANKPLIMSQTNRE